MSRIAQKLCDEIAAPSYRFRNNNSQACNYEDKSKLRIVAGKQRNNLVRQRSTGRIKFKSREYSGNLRSSADAAVNTTNRGDNNVTELRKRGITKCNSRIPQQSRSSTKTNTRLVQTYNTKFFSYSDKACFFCADTTSCGTQFMVLLPSDSSNRSQGMCPTHSRNINASLRDNTRPTKISNRNSLESADGTHEILKLIDLRKSNLVKKDSRHQDMTDWNSDSSRIPNVNFMGARRWSLSQYSQRGPDF